MKEVFKKIKGYEGLYEVSDFGRVKSLRFGKERILKGGVDSNGYLTVTLWKDSKQKTNKIHQLVAVAFLDHITCGFKLVVNHIDFNKQNNNVDNLEIVTSRQNLNQKHRKSSSKFTGVSWYKQSKKWKAQIDINGKKKHLGYFVSELDASNAYQTALLNHQNKK